MKRIINNYIFDKVAKKVTFTDYTTIRLENILLITDVTNGKIIYNFNDNAKGGVVSGNELTLFYNTDTSSFANTDKLQIFYDDPFYHEKVQPRSAVTNKILSYYPDLETHFPNIQGVFCDDNFSPENMHGWATFKQASESVNRYDVGLSDKGYFSDYCLELRTPNKASAMAYARKSRGAFTMPGKAKKIILGMYVSWHSWWLNGFYRFFISLDTQRRLPGPIDDRFWGKIAYVENMDGTTPGRVQKWMYDAKYTDGVPNFQDIPDELGNPTTVYPIPWNEPFKDMWAKVWFSIDYENQTYDILAINDDKIIDMRSLPVSNANETHEILPDYYNGANYIIAVQNRSSGTKNASWINFDRPFLAYEL